MGSEIGDWNEWSHDRGLPWEVLQYDFHRKLQTYARDLNRLYRSHPALYEVDFNYTGFEWIDFHDVQSSIISFLRRGLTEASSCSFAISRRFRVKITGLECQPRVSIEKS